MIFAKAPVPGQVKTRLIPLLGPEGPAVLTETLRRLHDAAIPVELLPFWYDVDTPSDLEWLAEHIRWLARSGGDIPHRTADFLKTVHAKRGKDDDRVE